MNYIELINQFWKIRREKQFTAYEADLYYYLLNECNSRMWLNPFELQTNLLCAELGISRKTLSDLRNRLSQKGLIEFEAGDRNKRGAVYEIKHVSESNIHGNQNGNIQGNIQGNILGNILGNPIKNKLNKNKLNKDIDKSISKKFVPPKLEEVREYCNEKKNEISAETFVNFYESKGWMVGKNKMKDWRAAVRTWENKNRNKNETDRRSDTAESDSEARKRYIIEKAARAVAECNSGNT